MPNLPETNTDSCDTNNHMIKEKGKEGDIHETLEIEKIGKNSFDETIESCNNIMVEVPYIKENNESLIGLITQSSQGINNSMEDTNGSNKENISHQDLDDFNNEPAPNETKEVELNASDSSFIDFDIILNTEYDSIENIEGSHRENKNAIQPIHPRYEIMKYTPPKADYIILFPIESIQSNQSDDAIDLYRPDSNRLPKSTFKKKLTILFENFRNLKIFSSEYLFIWNLIALLPLVFITNKVIFSQICLISTLYENEKKNYTFVVASIIAMLFSNDIKVSIDNYDEFFSDVELRLDNVSKTTRKNVYYLSDWDFSHLPENPITQEEEIDPIMTEMQTKFKTFDFLRSKNININGTVRRSILFQVKKIEGTTKTAIINVETDKFINNNIKTGVEKTAELLPVVISVENHIFIFYIGKSIKIKRQLNLKNHAIFIFYPEDLVSYLERIMLTQVSIPRNSINRYINAHLLHECDLYFLHL